jgi:protein arginine kinase
VDLEQFTCGRRSKWLTEAGPDGEIVLSSRVRLARNLRHLPFPFLASDSQTEEVIRQVDGVCRQHTAAFAEFSLLPLKSMPALVRQVLVEERLVSPLLVREPRNSALLLHAAEDISIMVNEEDHLRLQCLLPGLQLEAALREACKYDDLLEEDLDFAFHEEWGYLTACPTNAGTGLRASVMVHLPGLVLTGQLGRVLSAVAQVGLAVRGLHGEGSEMSGNLVQISNQVTLGRSEEEIISNLHGVTRQIIEQELQARRLLLNEGGDFIADRVNRALGLLTHARLLPAGEAVQHLSDVKLGVDLGLLENVPPQVHKELMVMQSPACLQLAAGKELTELECNRERSRVIRQHLQN